MATHRGASPLPQGGGAVQWPRSGDLKMQEGNHTEAVFRKKSEGVSRAGGRILERVWQNGYTPLASINAL